MDRPRLTDRFTPTPNPDAPDGGILYDYEETLWHPFKQIWTVLDNGAGQGHYEVRTGYRQVKALGYLITAERWTALDEQITFIF